MQDFLQGVSLEMSEVIHKDGSLYTPMWTLHLQEGSFMYKHLHNLLTTREFV
jgi:hypothetical protein